MDWFPGLVIGAMVILISIGICASIQDVKNHDRLIKQCMDSGKQEWECHAALDEHESVVPVFIPSGR